MSNNPVGITEGSVNGPPGNVGQINRALDEWLDSLAGPRNPPFQCGADFKNEWGRLFRLLSISVALTGALLGIDKLVLSGSSLALAPAFKIVAGFGLAAVLYSIYGCVFGMRVSPRQAFFCFALILLPWVPVFAAVKVAGPHLNFWFLAIVSYVLYVYLFILVGKGLSKITGAHLLRASLSLVPGITLIILSILLAPAVPTVPAK